MDRRAEPALAAVLDSPGWPSRSSGDFARSAVVEVLLARSAGGSGGAADVGQGPAEGLRSLIETGPGAAERLGFRHAGPAHPRDRGVRVITELLGYPFGAAPAAERADGRSDGLPDLPGTRFP